MFLFAVCSPVNLLLAFNKISMSQAGRWCENIIGYFNFENLIAKNDRSDEKKLE